MISVVIICQTRASGLKDWDRETGEGEGEGRQ